MLYNDGILLRIVQVNITYWLKVGSSLVLRLVYVGSGWVVKLPRTRKGTIISHIWTLSNENPCTCPGLSPCLISSGCTRQVSVLTFCKFIYVFSLLYKVLSLRQRPKLELVRVGHHLQWHHHQRSYNFRPRTL